jgi:hypothetical protein
MKNKTSYITNLSLAKLAISVIFALIFSLVLTGFIYGVFTCTDCGSGIDGLFGRLWISIVHVFLTLITLGKPWKNEGGGSSVNLQPCVLIVSMVVTYFTYKFLQRKNTRN